jgi:CYTH domain-containing protein
LNMCEEDAKKLADKVYRIEQGYLFNDKGLTVRIRKQVNRKTCYWMAVKTRVGPRRVIEVEKKISERDYLEMSVKASGWLAKFRYVIGDWEVDFFKNGEETYFVMAEIELPDGVEKPSKIPHFISKSLLYAVPAEDCRFSSKKLSDVKYAREILAKVSVF